MTDIDLDAIEARAAHASPGPWSLQESEWPEVMDAEDRWIVADWGEWMGPLTADRNAEFIAHAREDVPALIAEVRRLREERAAAFEEAVTAVRVYTPVLVDGGTVYVPRAAVIADIRAIKDQRPHWLGDTE